MIHLDTRPDERTAPAAPAAKKTKAKNRTVRLYVVDALIAALFLLVLNVPLTGLAVHEWLGIAIAIGTAVHTIQHYDWVWTTSKKIRSTALKNKVNGAMTVALFIAYGTIIASGLIISEVALPGIGVDTSGSATFWLWLHLSSVTATIWLTAFHVALNWKWILTTTTRYVIRPMRLLIGLEAT